MDNYSLSDIKSVVDGNDGMFGGSGGFGWLIILLLFFGFGNGGGFFGNRPYEAGAISDLERDVLNGNAATQKEIIESRYTTQLGFQASQAQMSSCCCDLKTAIHAEGEATRALINANTIQELRDRLDTANNALTVQTISNNVVSQLQPTAKPAYITCSPYTSYNHPFGYYGNCCGGSVI